MATLMVINIYQSVTIVNLDHVVAVEPLSTGGCNFHMATDGTRNDGKPGHYTIACTDDFQSTLSRLQGHSGITFVP